MNIKLPKLSDDAKTELPGATSKVSDSKGSFLHWVFSLLMAIIAVLGWLYNGSNSARIKQYQEALIVCEQKSEATMQRLLDKLEGVERKAEQVNVKTDSLVERTINNNDKVNEANKKLKNGLR